MLIFSSASSLTVHSSVGCGQSPNFFYERDFRRLTTRFALVGVIWQVIITYFAIMLVLMPLAPGRSAIQWRADRPNLCHVGESEIAVRQKPGDAPGPPKRAPMAASPPGPIWSYRIAAQRSLTDSEYRPGKGFCKGRGFAQGVELNS
jgi:hypothetical protein